MRAKGTSVWEQYIEYVAILVAVAILVWFAWGAFGTKIEHKQGRTIVQTNNVDEELLKAATALEAKIREGTQSPIVIHAPEAMHDQFSSYVSQSVSPRDRVVFPGLDMTAELDDTQNVQSELREYVTPSIPEPQNVRSMQWFGTLSEGAMAEVEELNDLIDGPPHDTTWIQIASTIDIASILESYAASDSLAAIPARWFDEAIDIFDVEIERQQLLEDGEWSTSELVSTLPGHMSYRVKLDEGSIDAIERNAIIRELRTGVQDAVITPDFYMLKGLNPSALRQPASWSGDVEIEETPLQLLEKELSEAEDAIEKQEELIDRINEEIRGAGGRGGMGGSGGGSGQEQKIERLRRKLDKAKERLESLVEEKETIELQIEELKAESNLDEGESILEGEVWIWGHDVGVDAGETYRYRTRILVANPFFGHKPSLYPSQHALAETVELTSDQSAWSAPVRVQESEQWFVKKAKALDMSDPQDLLSRGYISVDVFEFSDGAWVKKSRDIQVGEPIAVDKEEEDLGWFVLDVIEDVQGEVALIQNLESGQIIPQRPELAIENDQLRHLLEQIREQNSTDDSEEDDSDSGGKGGTGGQGGGGMGGMGGGMGG